MKCFSLKVIVGSKNPVKLNATRNILERIFSDLTITATDVDSEIPDQPFGLDQTIEGAINRAKNAFDEELILVLESNQGLWKHPTH